MIFDRNPTPVLEGLVLIHQQIRVFRGSNPSLCLYIWHLYDMRFKFSLLRFNNTTVSPSRTVGLVPPPVPTIPFDRPNSTTNATQDFLFVVNWSIHPFLPLPSFPVKSISSVGSVSSFRMSHICERKTTLFTN